MSKYIFHRIVFSSLYQASSVSLIKCQCCPHIETSQLTCTENQWTGFYIRETMTFNGLT